LLDKEKDCLKMQKYYQLGTHTEAEWDELHAELTGESDHCDHVPERCVECADDQLHSPTRGTYLLNYHRVLP
jgi:hypothetical protein